MKKLLLSMLFLVGGVMLSPALADEYLKICGQKVTGSGTLSSSAIKSGKVTYTSNSVTFENVNIDYSFRVLECTLSGNFRIDFKGDCTIKGGTGCIKIDKSDNKDVDLSGDLTGNVTLESTASNFAPLNISGKGGYDMYLLNFKSLSLKRLESDTRGIIGDNTNRLCIHNSFVTINSGGSATIEGLKSMWLSSAVYFNPSNAIYSQSAYELQSGGSSYTGALTIYPMLRVEGNYVNTVSDETTGSGWKYTKSNNTLTFTNHTWSGETYCVSYFGSDDFTVKASGNNTMTMTAGAGDFLWVPNCNLTIEGSSHTSDKITMKATSTSGNIGVRGMTKKLTVKNITLNMSTKTDKIFGGNDAELEIVKSNVNLECTGSHYAVEGYKSCTLTNCCVNTGETPVLFNESLKSFADIEGNKTKKLVIGVPTKTYRTDVCGVAINDLTKDNVIVPGLTKGKISYTPGANDYEGTLKLNGVTLASTVGNQAVFRPGMNAQDKVTITISGDNYLSGGHSTLYPGGSLTINGSGNLYCDATGSNFGAFYQTGGNVTSTIAVDGVVKFEKGKYGYYVGYSTSPNDKLILKKNGNSDYYFIGTSCAINSTSLVLDGMDFYGKSSEGGFPGCYFDETAKCVKQNGGVTATGANFYQVHTEYDIKILGTKLNNCTVHGFGSKCITGGGPTAVTYDSQNKILKLNGATIKQESSVSAVYNAYPGIDGLTINVEGTNSLTDAGGYALYLGNNTTLTGSGSLEVSSFWGFNGTITLKDLNAKFKGNLPASSPGKLVVDLTTAGKKVEVTDYVYGWDMVSTLNGTKMWGADDQEVYFDTSEKYIVYNDGTKAKHVIFTDKTATTDIDAIEVANDTEVKQIYDATGRESSTAKSGLNIIRMSDGTVRKIMVK